MSGWALQKPPTITPGIAGVVDPSAIAVDTDTQGMRVQWSEFDTDDFSGNDFTHAGFSTLFRFFE